MSGFVRSEHGRTTMLALRFEGPASFDLVGLYCTAFLYVFGDNVVVRRQCLCLHKPQ